MELCAGGELFDRIIESGHFSEALWHRVAFVNADALQIPTGPSSHIDAADYPPRSEFSISISLEGWIHS